MSEPLTFVTFKWKPPVGYRSTFEGRHVDTLAAMIQRHYQAPHRIVCVTDDASDITSPDVECFELWGDLATIRNPSGGRNPSCYRRLRVFAANAGEWLGPRFCMLDLDAVILGDLTSLLEPRDEDFMIWRSATPGNPYNGSMIYARSGAVPQLWEDFDAETVPASTKRAGFYGSDQAWIGMCLGRDRPTFGPEHGVLSYRNDLREGADEPPAGSRVVFFHGKTDPWSPAAQRLNWVAENYR